MGRACVDRVLGLADHVVAVDLQAPEIDGVVGVACDVTDVSAVSAVAERVRGLGRFAALAHAAGVSPTMAEPRRIVEVNVLGTLHVLDAFEPLVADGSAAVCFASSAGHFPIDALGPELAELVRHPRADGFLDHAASLLPDPGLAYAWSKKAVLLEATDAAMRWARRGGRVMSVSPGNIDTPMGRQEFAHQRVMREAMEQHPMHRWGTADEVAAVVAFLLGDDASFVSGIDVRVDGGAHAASM
jgi:NAD(P)-dependent dehydrogenase (short-subunit alcohol dehydrogenase family)